MKPTNTDHILGAIYSNVDAMGLKHETKFSVYRVNEHFRIESSSHTANAENGDALYYTDYFKLLNSEGYDVLNKYIVDMINGINSIEFEDNFKGISDLKQFGIKGTN